MARHNREGRGVDQHDQEYVISYQPDWLRYVKVTRQLTNGRQSTLTLFKNPSRRQESPPGHRVRTRITCASQDLDIEVTVNDAGCAIRQVRVACSVGGTGRGGEEEIAFTLVNGLPTKSDG